MKHAAIICISCISTVAVADTAHDFTFPRLEGGELALSEHAGEVLLIANTASLCAFTPQYEALQSVADEYADAGLVVIGIPSDDFGGQELESAEAVQDFCTLTYDITFPMTDITTVKGRGAHPFFDWIAAEGGRSALPRWNFTKYLVSREGEFLGSWPSGVRPTGREMRAAIEAALDAQS